MSPVRCSATARRASSRVGAACRGWRRPRRRRRASRSPRRARPRRCSACAVADEAHQARHIADPDDEHPSRAGVERAGVADAALPKRRRSMPTTSWLVTPAGLSTTPARGRSAGGGAPPLRSVVAVSADDLLDPLRGPDHVVWAEDQHGRLLGADLVVDRRLDAAAVLLEHLEQRGVAVLALEVVEVDDRPVELVVDVDRRDRDERQPLVVDLDQLLGDHLAQRLAEPGTAWVPMSTGAPTCTHGRQATARSTRARTYEYGVRGFPA